MPVSILRQTLTVGAGVAQGPLLLARCSPNPPAVVSVRIHVNCPEVLMTLLCAGLYVIFTVCLVFELTKDFSM